MLLRLTSAASAGQEIVDRVEEWAGGWILDLLLPPPNATAAANSWQNEEVLASMLRAAAAGPACVPRNDQIRVARLAAAAAGGGGVERWAAEVRESADLGPLVPAATRLAAALVEAGRDGRLCAQLPGCRITDCQPLLLDSE